MARAIEKDWGFGELARRFEAETQTAPRTGRASSRKWLPLPSAGTAHVGAWLFTVAMSLVGLVALHVIILQKNVEQSNIVREKNALIAETAKLSGEVSTLRSPERIEQIATRTMGMVPADKMQYVYINPFGEHQSYAEANTPYSGRPTPP
jgi:cell division protein FtsL